MSASMEMPKYRCHKEVWALAIEKITKHMTLDGVVEAVVLTPVDKRYGPFDVTLQFWNKNKDAMKVGGYFVVYPDGYQSWSPAKAFEEGYTLVGNNS